MRLAIFGNPIKHSLSPQIHMNAMEKLGIECEYVIREQERLCKDDFADLNGGNITTPFKEVAFDLCDEFSKKADFVKCANTIIKREDGSFMGHNTDVDGFEYLVKELAVDKKRVLLFGVGPTAKSCAVALAHENYDITIINRSAYLGTFFEKVLYKSDTDSLNADFDLIVNATSSSLNSELPIDRAILERFMKGAKFAVDVSYRTESPFLEVAEDLGVANMDGKKMLIYQAMFAGIYFIGDKAEENGISFKDIKEAYTSIDI